MAEDFQVRRDRIKLTIERARNRARGEMKELADKARRAEKVQRRLDKLREDRRKPQDAPPNE